MHDGQWLQFLTSDLGSWDYPHQLTPCLVSVSWTLGLSWEVTRFSA